MEKYRVFIGEKEYLIGIDGDRVFIDGEPVYVGIHFLNENGLVMVEKDDGKQEYHIKSQDDGTLRVTSRGLQVDATVEPVKGRKKRQTEKKDTGTIAAPIPGVVISIFIQPGDIVEKDQVLVVLESMKMLMEFRAPSEGQVEKVSVTEGQKVEKGDEMVKIKKDD
ncbi:MAG: acetyl-CoA carboxylase biotin carboxyl carrier protein subunit [Pelolinea sp.]|nr:acetyl-CoA carboxylase biotin carboxyl carrier protein subunit [Pelolinea sp.]